MIMNTWYKTFGTTVEPVEVESDTEHFVKLAGCKGRDAKRSDYFNFFPTRADAVAHVLQRAADKVGRLEVDLEQARKAEAAVKAKYADEETP